MVGSIGPRLLDALEDGVYHHSCIRFSGCGRCGPEDVIDPPVALDGYLRLLTSVVSLLGVRSSPLRGGTGGNTQALRDAAWGALLLAGSGGGGANDEDDMRVRRAATALITLLPLLAGGGSDAPSLPSEAWLRSTADDAAMLRWAIDDFFPLAARGPGGGRNGGSGGGSGGARTENAAAGDDRLNPRGEHAAWVAFTRDAPSTGEGGAGMDNDNGRGAAIDPPSATKDTEVG
jgi:hypothetical protein